MSEDLDTLSLRMLNEARKQFKNESNATNHTLLVETIGMRLAASDAVRAQRKQK